MNDFRIAETWYPWNSGRCPVADDVTVAVRCRYSPQKIARAIHLQWSHDQYVGYGADDIIAYAIVDMARPFALGGTAA